MLRFILNILAVLVTSLAILLLLTFNWVNFESIDFTSASGKHILSAGPSTSACAVNDNLSQDIINYSHLDYDMDVANLLLDKMLKQNPQVDTVLIYAGRLSMFLGTPDMSQISLHELKTKIQIIVSGIIEGELSGTLKHELVRNPYFYGALLSPDFSNFIKRRDLPTDERFMYEAVHKTLDLSPETDAKWGIKWYNDNKPFFTTDTINAKYVEGLNRAIDICRDNGVEPVLFMTPLYEYDRWYPWAEHISPLKGLDGTLLVADYEDFEMPDHTYYGDVHHLNVKGAEYFTKALARDGIRCVRLSDWIKDKDKHQ